MFRMPFVTYDIVNKYSLLVHAKGSEIDSPPYMIAAHLDVVPLSDIFIKQFPVKCKDNYMYGAGVIDSKMTVIVSVNLYLYTVFFGLLQ